MLGNAPVVNSSGILGRLDERKFRALADRVNSLLHETISAGLFAQEREIVFNEGAQLLTEVRTWTGTTIPPPLLKADQAVCTSFRSAGGREAASATGALNCMCLLLPT